MRGVVVAELPPAGSLELVRLWETMVVFDAARWRKDPQDVNAEFLAKSVDKYVEAEAAFFAETVRVAAETQRLIEERRGEEID